MKKALFPALLLSLALLTGCTEDKPVATTVKPAGAETTAAAAPESTAMPSTGETAAAPVTTTAEPQPETTAAVTEAPVTEAPTEQPTQAPATEAPTEAPQRVDPWSLMGEASFDQGSYTDNVGNSYTYSYAIPCLLADTPDAKAVNADIDAFFGKMVREQKEGIEAGTSLSLSSVGYYGEVWGDVLSLVVMGHWDWEFTDYRVYCYDVSTGSRLDTAAVLDKMGITQADFLETCKARFRQCFEENYSSIPVEQRDTYGYNEALKTVDGPDYVNMDLMIYPSATGDLQVVAPIVSLAGAAYYFQVINSGLSAKN